MSRPIKDETSKPIVHVPHSSIVIPPDVRARILLDDNELDQELLRLTDWFTQEMVEEGATGATLPRYPVSRLVVDPERFRDDEMEPMAEVGMGAVYTRTLNGGPLRKIDESDKEDLLKRFFDPHHERMNNLAARMLREQDRCLIIDLHSFPSEPFPYEMNPSMERPDICIGTDDFHTPEPLVEKGVRYFEGQGLGVRINEPFAGAFVPTKYYRRDKRVQAIMVEVNRRLYMNERTGEKTPGFGRVKKVLSDFIIQTEHE
jgi:N-formylglutamate amidohydrolase